MKKFRERGSGNSLGERDIEEVRESFLVREKERVSD